VYAYDLERQSLAWEFNAARVMPDLPENAYTAVAVDGQRVLVSVDQTIMGLDAASGRLLWTTALPRQSIPTFSNPWTTFGRVGHHLLVACYEMLFMLDPGRLLWSFSVGLFDEPWPTIDRERLYVATRQGPVEIGSTTFVGEPPPRMLSALRVRRDREAPAGYLMEYLSRHDIPAAAPVWWSLAPPPATGSSERLTLELIDDPDDARKTTIDTTVPLHETGVAYVKFGNHPDRVRLLRNGQEILSQKGPAFHY
jgi:hypothetical protein